MARGGLRSGLALVLTCAAGSIASPLPAGAMADTLSPPGVNADAVRVAMDAAGDTFAVWTVETASEEYAIEAATRPAGGSWQAPAIISEPGKSSYRPALAADGRGDAVAVWQGSGPGNELVSAAVHPAGGVWQPATPLSEAGQRAGQAAVAINPEGEAVAVWQRSNGSQLIVQASSHPAAGSWGSPASISPAGNNSSEPTVAMDIKGDALAAWDVNGYDVVSALRPAGKNWKGSSWLPNAEDEPTAPHIGFDAAGNAIAAWSVLSDTEENVRAAILPTGKGWQAPATITAPGNEAFLSGLAVDPAGDATAVWSQSGAGGEVIQSATMPAHGTWQAPIDLSRTESHPRDAAIVTDVLGEELLTWDSSNGTDSIVRARTRQAGGSWGGELNLTAPGEPAFVGGEAIENGTAVVAAQRENADLTRSIQSNTFPITGTLQDPAAIPVTGIAGTPITASVGPQDGLSSLAGATWSFGDGASATGATVTHTYSSAGTYVVTANAIDTFENAFADSQTISIAPARAIAPVLSAIAQSAASWREGTREASIASKRKPPVGTTFSFSLNEAAALSFTFTTRAGGRRVKGRCVAQGPHNLHAARCVRSLLRGSLSLRGHAGHDSVRFQGLLSKHSRLGPGTYELTAVAETGGLKSAPRSLHFTVLR